MINQETPSKAKKNKENPRKNKKQTEKQESVNAGGATCRRRAASCTELSIHWCPIIRKLRFCKLLPEGGKWHRFVYSSMTNNFPTRSFVACGINTMQFVACGIHAM